MLEQNSTKVKRKIRKVVDAVSSRLSVPDYKFALEMITASFSSGRLNLMDLARSLHEDIGIKHTHKRLQRHVAVGGHFLDLANNYSLSHPAEPIADNTFIYLDGGDLTYSQANGYEFMSLVHDGSTGKLKQGYPLNLIACRNASGRAFPVYLNIFNRVEKTYTSDNTETLGTIKSFMAVHGSKGIWTLDRGYDNRRIMLYIMDEGGSFNIRLRGDRHLDGVRADELARSLNRRYKHGDGKFGYKCLSLCGYAVTLIYYKVGARELMLLNSGHISKSAEVRRRIQGYFGRWGVEDSYRFIKQSLMLERASVRSFEGIKCLLGLSMLAWQVLAGLREDEELTAIVLKEAKMITKKVKFDYYRLFNGFKMILDSVVTRF